MSPLTCQLELSNSCHALVELQGSLGPASTGADSPGPAGMTGSGSRSGSQYADLRTYSSLGVPVLERPSSQAKLARASNLQVA